MTSQPDTIPTGSEAEIRPGKPMGVFASRVAGVMTTQVALFGLAFFSSILLSRLLGPAGKGELVAVVTVPGMIVAIGMFGLPNAMNYFAGRGHSIASMLRLTYAFSLVMSVALVALVLFFLPVLERSIFRAAPDELLRVIVLTLPLSTLSAFAVAIMYGRHAVRTVNLIQLVMAAISLALVLILVAGLRLGVRGAVAGTISINVLMVGSLLIALHRLGRANPDGPPAPTRQVAAYGARVYPASITGYFHYRADTYLIQALILSALTARKMLGLYSVAVTMAEMVFYVPDSVGAIFLPRVAGATAEDANRMLGRVGRLTTLLTVSVALALIPVAILGIHLVLPQYVDCLPAFLTLLPGAVSFSVVKVMTSYIAGRGRPGLISVGTIASLVVNLVLNVLLIPPYGILGAALASLVSYTFQAVVALSFASRLSGQSPLGLFVPGREEVVLLARTLWRLWGAAPVLGRLRPHFRTLG
jgi:O-antigen/teichoic acid export membrane protein